ncbi:MAG: tetratricopeptide repeat protein [bacterium]
MIVRKDASPRAARNRDARGSVLALAGALALATFLLYLPSLDNEFVNWDDNEYVTQNPAVAAPSFAGVVSAFTEVRASNWHPATMLSHIADGVAFGLNPRGHHLTSIALHAANAALLFVVLARMTGARAPSFFVAALFAFHPLNVESVSWVSERKNVLSTFLWLATMWAYALYAARGGARRYALVAALFVAGLAAKPMLVTLPAVLVLLDMWPLRRAASRSMRALVWEKAPLFAIAAVSCVVTIVAQRAGGAVASLASAPLADRAANAAVSYTRYLLHAVWPADLSAIYPFPGSVEAAPLAVAQVAAAAAVLAALSAIAYRVRPSAPHVLVGWLWFLGTLVPVIGLVQVGNQAMANRYAYVPLIGVFIAVSWSAASVRSRGLGRALAICAAAALAGCAGATLARQSVWRDSESLWRATLASNPRSREAHNNYGDWLASAGRRAEAFDHFRAVIAIDSTLVLPRVNLGVALQDDGRLDEAAAVLREATRIAPNDADAQYNLAVTLARLGRKAEARAALARSFGGGGAPGAAGDASGGSSASRTTRAAFDEGLARRIAETIAGRDAAALYNLGIALIDLDEPARARAAFEASLAIQPNAPGALVNLGVVLGELGERTQAIAQFREALRLDPANAEAKMNLAAQLVETGDRRGALQIVRGWAKSGQTPPSMALLAAWILATAPEDELRSGADAVAIAEKLTDAGPREASNALALDVLAAAYAEAGRFAEAMSAAERASAAASSRGDTARARQIDERRVLYAAGRAFRDGR